MKNLTLLLLLFPFVGLAQHKTPPPARPPLPPTKEQMAWDKKHCRCFNSSKYNAEQRHSFFPFNSATTVRLISFSPEDIPYETVAVNNFSIDNSKIKESKILSINGIDSLTNILYNVGFTPMKRKRPQIKEGVYELREQPSRSMCIFQPRHAILFIDSTGKVTQYIAICFTCHQYYLSSRKIKYTVECENKYDLLRSYFVAQGIKYGTTPPKND